MKKNNLNSKYLFVDAKNVFNYPDIDFNIISYKKCDKPFIDLDELFDFYDIPLEYRFMILKINSGFFCFQMQELFTKVTFDNIDYSFFKRKTYDNDFIRGRANINNNSSIEFNTLVDFKDYFEVLSFNKKLLDCGLYSRYIIALSKIFSLCFDYNNDNINVLRKFRKR